MVTKEELYNLIDMAKTIERLEDELLEIYTRLEGVRSPIITNMPKGRTYIDIFELFAKAKDKQAEINYHLKELYTEKERILNLISFLECEEKKLIKLRYFENNTWEDIGSELGYSSRHAKRLHYKILDKLKNS